MFIVGLLVGPVAGVLVGDYLFRPSGPGRLGALGLIALLALAVLILPVFTPELKSGLVLGLLAGSLLAATPMHRGEEEPKSLDDELSTSIRI